MTDDKIFECCENNTSCARMGKIGLIAVRWFPVFFVFAMLVVSIYFFSIRLCSRNIEKRVFYYNF